MMDILYYLYSVAQYNVCYIFVELCLLYICGIMSIMFIMWNYGKIYPLRCINVLDI